ncbi:peptidoglycan-binding domain-containing protein [Streptomyces fumanus]|uniref:peptidoglycan-binding domain-containing protein n=1 Tax=Streptomyces fumanus TaxID=67302 RepID=UPI0033CC79C2
MAISATRRTVGIGVATLALLGGAASGVATARTGAAGTVAVQAHADDASAAAKKCEYTSKYGWYCGYYKGNATVRTGSKGNAVREVQALINQTTPYKPKLSVDGDFGGKTKKAVVWFQKTYKVKPYDGIVGKKTWAELRLK